MTKSVKVVIIGGSFGGLTAAYELRRRFGPETLEITLVSRDSRFTFVPSLTWVAVGSRKLSQISFGLEEPLGSRKIRFMREPVMGIDTDNKTVSTSKSLYPYDFLIIATGHRSANEAVEGLGPFGGPGHSPMSPPEADELAGAISQLLTNPGPLVVGAAPGASCIGPAYELAFEIDHLLRRKKLRHLVPMTYVTPEPYLGHMGMGGAGKMRQLLEAEFEERDIRYQVSAAVTRIRPDSVEVGQTRSIPSVLSIVIPPLAGVEAVAGTPGLANPKGFVPVDQHYRHAMFDGVYAVGVAVALPPVEETPVPVNFPKTGHMTEQMARVAASDITARIKGMAPEEPRDLSARCVLDMGDRGVYMSVDPVRPPRNKIPKISPGMQWLVTKRLFERSYLWRARHGHTLPTSMGW